MKEQNYIRKRIYSIIEPANDSDNLSKIYDIFMMITIMISIFPLCFTYQTAIFKLMDKITVMIFIFDYALRLITADYKLDKHKTLSFLLYPLTPMALIDLLSILPSLTTLNGGFKLFKIFRLFRTFRIFKLFKAVRYSKSIVMIVNIFKKQRHALITICGIAFGYILISALVILNVEPETFNNYFDAIYWATISLTTVGYGDIYAVSTIGKIITMISSIFGIAIVALPAGIITAGITEQISDKPNNQFELTNDEKNIIMMYRSMDQSSKEILENVILSVKVEQSPSIDKKLPVDYDMSNEQ